MEIAENEVLEDAQIAYQNRCHPFHRTVPAPYRQ
jgi:hypothetical protein